MTKDSGISLDLAGVPETMLWPLWNRARDHAAPHGLIRDPLAADLVERIAYDFARHFGRPSILHAIRARVGDDLIRAYLKTHPGGTVVALGEGLETQLWRIGKADLRWYSVDLPEAIATRQRLLPQDSRATAIACSALDPVWMTQIPTDPPPFISAAGLLMYFEEESVKGLMHQIAQRFGGAQLYFDTISPWFSMRTLKGFDVTRSYRAPPMPFGISIGSIRRFVEADGEWQVVFAKSYAAAFPQRMRLFYLLGHIPPLRDRFAPGLVHAVTRG